MENSTILVPCQLEKQDWVLMVCDSWPTTELTRLNCVESLLQQHFLLWVIKPDGTGLGQCVMQASTELCLAFFEFFTVLEKTVFSTRPSAPRQFYHILTLSLLNI